MGKLKDSNIDKNTEHHRL